jgi:hypothetical protein
LAEIIDIWLKLKEPNAGLKIILYENLKIAVRACLYGSRAGPLSETAR